MLLFDDLQASSCVVATFREIGEAIDLGTPTGRLLVHLIASLAEFERGLIRDRVQAGLARVKATGHIRSGKAVGHPRRLTPCVRAVVASRRATPDGYEFWDAIATPSSRC
jgi:DNA invertase Pin-like site-specific DNA recombinase